MRAPPCATRTVSPQSASRSSRSCETSTPAPAKRRSAATRSARASASRWLVGSSSTRQPGSRASAAPICQRLRSPGESVGQRASASGSSWSAARIRRATPSCVAANASSASPDSSTRCGASTTSSPTGSRTTRPASGASSPASRRSSVVLPEPLAPTTPVQPAPKRSETSWKSGAESRWENETRSKETCMERASLAAGKPAGRGSASRTTQPRSSSSSTRPLLRSGAHRSRVRRRRQFFSTSIFSRRSISGSELGPGFMRLVTSAGVR